MKVLLTVKNAKAITKSGRFTADNIFSTVVLKVAIPDLTLARVDNIMEGFPSNVIIYDNSLNKSSFGLIWSEFGMQYLRNKNCPSEYCKYVFSFIRENIGNPLSDIYTTNSKNTRFKFDLNSIERAIELFNPKSDSFTKKESNICFVQAVNFAQRYVDNIFETALHESRQVKNNPELFYFGY